MDFSVLLTDLPTLVGVIIGVPRCSPPISWAASTWSGACRTKRAPPFDRGSGSRRRCCSLPVSSFCPRSGPSPRASRTTKALCRSHQLRQRSWRVPDRGRVDRHPQQPLLAVFYTLFVLCLRPLLAVLFDRVPYEKHRQVPDLHADGDLVGRPVVIWKFMYAYQPPGQPQTGTLNFDPQHRVPPGSPDVGPGRPRRLLGLIPLNDLALITAAVWGIVGFSIVILSAALKGISGRPAGGSAGGRRRRNHHLQARDLSADDAHGRGRGNDAGDLRAQGFRRRLCDDERQLPHRRARQPHVSAALHTSRTISEVRARWRSSCSSQSYPF